MGLIAGSLFTALQNAAEQLDAEGHQIAGVVAERAEKLKGLLNSDAEAAEVAAKEMIAELVAAAEGK